MGKQTKKAGSKFGGEWTQEKLEIVDKYLGFYTSALKKFSWAKLVYIDAFAGSGKTKISDGTEVEGSPAIALKYEFEKYYFIEYDSKRKAELEEYIKTNFPDKVSRVEFIEGDCNIELPKIFEALAKNHNYRGVMFLDPYALELKWEILEKAKSVSLDVWYLFPMMANRLITKDKKKLDDLQYREKLISLLGSDEFEKVMYKETGQISMFDEVQYVKEPVKKLIEYVADKLKDLYGGTPRMKPFKNAKDSTIFLLCFFITNPSEKAYNLANKVVGDIFGKIDKDKTSS